MDTGNGREFITLDENVQYLCTGLQTSKTQSVAIAKGERDGPTSIDALHREVRGYLRAPVALVSSYADHDFVTDPGRYACITDVVKVQSVGRGADL
jgi:hypothetical protein